jgi:thioredoxin reductase
MNAPHVAPFSAAAAAPAQPHAVADQWLNQWEAACASGQADAVASCLTPNCHWRDLVAFDWSVQTWSGQATVVEQLCSRLAATHPTQWRRHATKPITRWVERDGHHWLEVGIEFDTQLARGEGLVRLKPQGNGQWQAWTLMTTVQWFRGHEPRHMRLASPTEHIRRFQGPNWADRRAEAMQYNDREPEVLVVGAGQAGLSVAARLTQLGVDTLVVDKHQRLGDNWRTRYHALVLHNKATVNHLPFMPFPSTWPTYIPKDKLADWMAYYAEAMEINHWMSTEFQGAQWQESTQTWHVRLKRNGTERLVRPRHVVLATGVSAVPNRTPLEGMEAFAGQVMHTHDYQGAQPWLGKRVVVFGSGTSGHDVAQDLQNHGVEVCMVQRSPTMVQNIEPTAQLPYELYDGELGTDVCDLITVGTPMDMIKAANLRYLKLAQASDMELHEGLRRAGFRLDDGSSHGMNWQMLYLTRGGGYYFNVGCSNLIADGQLPVLALQDIAHFESDGLRMKDGRHVPADLMVTATGYHGISTMVEQLMGKDIADRVGPVWGIDEQTQELANMWQPTPQPGLWFIAGAFAQCRIYSQPLALQIQAQLRGLNT